MTVSWKPCNVLSAGQARVLASEPGTENPGALGKQRNGILSPGLAGGLKAPEGARLTARRLVSSDPDKG